MPHRSSSSGSTRFGRKPSTSPGPARVTTRPSVRAQRQCYDWCCRTLSAAMIPASEALTRLREGNRRFVSGLGNTDGATGARRREVAAAQEPFAIILGCSDSRVPAELVFDQGLGDLFVIRVAGNIVAPSQV